MVLLLTVASVCWVCVPDAWTAGYVLARFVSIDVGCYVLPHNSNMLPQRLLLSSLLCRFRQ